MALLTDYRVQLSVGPYRGMKLKPEKILPGNNFTEASIWLNTPGGLLLVPWRDVCVMKKEKEKKQK